MRRFSASCPLQGLGRSISLGVDGFYDASNSVSTGFYKVLKEVEAVELCTLG